MDSYLVIHGRADAPTGKFETLAKTLARHSGIQVLLLDWSQGAADNYIPQVGLYGAEWIPYVADWAASALRNIGIGGVKLNLGGHSWGSYVAARIAAPERSGMVNALVAMDPARAGVGFAADSIDFGAVSRISWAFHGNGSFGSAKLAATADESFSIVSDEFSRLPYLSSLERHTAPVHVFEYLARNNVRAFGGLFSLKRLMGARRNTIWQIDAYSSEKSTFEGPVQGFEGVFKVGRITASVDDIWQPITFDF